MNAEEAYERHTDVVRALSDPDSDARAAFAGYLDQRPRSHLPGMVQLADGHHLLALGESGAETAQVSIAVDWQVHDEPEGTGALDTVGVEDPDADNRAAGETSDAILLPVSAYLEASVYAFTKAATFYVTADMCALLEHAAASLDETDVMAYRPEHPSGFVVLARPLRLPYGDGTEQVVDAFAWAHYDSVRTVFGTAGRAGTVFQFTDRVKNPNERGVGHARETHPSKSAWARSPRLVLTMADDYVTGAPVGPTVEGVDRERVRRRRIEAMRNEETSPATVGPVVGRFQPYLAAFLLLLSQQVTAPVLKDAGAGPVRRANRAGRTGHGTEKVTVVDLRRRTHHDPAVAGEPGASGRHYQVRHLVGGHWKWQPCGPEHRLRRRIFVEGYVRGPEDQPLVVKPKVYRL